MLSILFGLGWGIGLLATEKLGNIFIRDTFSSLFVIATIFHGLLIFILHCARSKEARKEWLKWFFKVTRRELSDLTSSAFDHFHHHQRTRSSQAPSKTFTHKATEMTAVPSSITSPCPLSSDETSLKVVLPKDHELAEIPEQDDTQDMLKKPPEAEMETKLDKEALVEMEPQHGPNTSTPDPAATPAKAMKNGKVEELHLTSLNASEKEDKGGMIQPKEIGIEDGKQHSQESKCFNMTLDDYNKNEAPTANTSLEDVMSDKD